MHMLMLRLQRVGRRNEPHYKLVVIEKSKGPKSHKYVDIVGSYNPKAGQVTIDEDKAKKWLSHGVQPSDTVRNMLITKGLLEGRKVNNLPQKSPVVDLVAIAAAKEAAEAKAKAQQEAAKAEAEAAALPQEVVAEESEEVAEEPAVAEETASEEESVEEPSADDLEAALEGAPEKATKTEE